jgi:hypothetical protein
MQSVFWCSTATVVAAVLVWLIGFLMLDMWDPSTADMKRWGFRFLGVAVGLALASGLYLKQKGVPFVEDSNKCSCSCKTTICEIPVQK